MNVLKKIIFTLCLLIMGCDSDNAFPDVYINKSIYVTGPEFIDLYNNLWAYEYEDGGLGGIIIVQAMNNTFIAYDRACTFEASENCIVTGEINNMDPVLVCKECCNSKFVVNDGSVIDGPANQALKRYNTYFDGTFLYITN